MGTPPPLAIDGWSSAFNSAQPGNARAGRRSIHAPYGANIGPSSAGFRLLNAPGDALAGAQRHDGVFAERVFAGHLEAVLHEGDRALVPRQPVEVRAMQAR